MTINDDCPSILCAIQVNARSSAAGVSGNTA